MDPSSVDGLQSTQAPGATTAAIQSRWRSTTYTRRLAEPLVAVSMPCRIPRTLVLFAAFAAMPASAQTTVIQTENVRNEYARVLRVEPVYQTLRATAMVERCEQSTLVVREGEEENRSGLGRMFGAVKNALTPGEGDSKAESSAPAASGTRTDCRMVPVDRQFRRPIAYDVDYVHHGIRYRSRLPYDPGDRMRVRVSITPIVPGQAAR